MIDRDAAATTAAAMAALLAEFNAYLDREHADPTADSVGYRQVPLWLNQDELAELISEIRSAIVSRMDNKPEADRSLHLLSPVLFPIEELPQHSTGKRPTTAGEPEPVRAGRGARKDTHIGMTARNQGRSGRLRRRTSGRYEPPPRITVEEVAAITAAFMLSMA
jgi:hypothetical protein